MSKRSALDEAVFQAWDELAFRNYKLLGPTRTPEEYLELTRSQLPEWMALLAMAYADGRWKADSGNALSVSTGIWYSAMALEQYDLAEEAIARCQRHPGPSSRADTADLPQKLLTTHWVRDRNPDAANALAAHVHCGIYRPSRMARSIFHSLACWIRPLREDVRGEQFPVNDASRGLALTIAVALRASKRHQKASETLQTWEAFGDHLAFSAGFERVEDASETQ